MDANLEDGVAPQQCPNCGRFLKNALVHSLAGGDQPCPGCAEPITAQMFDTPASTEETVATNGRATSIRPPDLAPAKVRDDGNVLAGWDTGASAAEVAGWRDDQPPFPTDTVAVAGAALIGSLLGAALGSARLRGALLGAGIGAVTGAAVRQVWRLQE